MKLEINVNDERDGWMSATVEDVDGNVLGDATAPVVEGATFDVRASVIRAAVEFAIRTLNAGFEVEE